MSELQAHDCMTSEHLSWLVCSVSFIPANETSLQELHQLIEINLLTSDFLDIFSSQPNFQGEMPV